MFKYMHEIGRIKLVQIQRSPLKVGGSRNAYYDPSPLLVVDTLHLTSKGAIGVTARGDHIIDIHHVDHSSSRNRRGANGLSVGFSSHYAAMRARFGHHLIDGCAGENILVETDSPFRLSDLEGGLAIQNPDTGQFLYLTQLKVAAPCVEFTQYAANHGMALPAEQLRAALQFLHDGRRGFYARLAKDQDSGSVRANDRVFIIERVEEENQG